MAANVYKKSTNPFQDEDVDDETFLKNSRRPQSSFDDEIQSLQEKRKQIDERTLQSTERSIGILRDSEQIGIATAEELSRQREQLERTDKRLDEINATLRFSQKHINGIKSVFSSLKNFVSGKSDSASPTSVSSSSNKSQRINYLSKKDIAVLKKDSSHDKQPSTDLQETVLNYDRYENHPTTRLRNTDLGNVPSQKEEFGSKNISAKLDANLQEMCSSISKLKGLAIDLSYEIDTQNGLIDNITDKTEIADITIQKQSTDMQKLLKK